MNFARLAPILVTAVSLSLLACSSEPAESETSEESSDELAAGCGSSTELTAIARGSFSVTKMPTKSKALYFETLELAANGTFKGVVVKTGEAADAGAAIGGSYSIIVPRCQTSDRTVTLVPDGDTTPVSFLVSPRAGGELDFHPTDAAGKFGDFAVRGAAIAPSTGVPPHAPGTICATTQFWCWATYAGPPGTSCLCKVAVGWRQGNLI